MRFSSSANSPLRAYSFLIILIVSICPGVGRLAMGEDAVSPPPPFAGTFHDDTITLKLTESPGGFAGTFTKGDNSFPAKATANGQALAGTFIASDHEFQFTATLADGHLILVSGGKTHSLARVVGNPLSRGEAPAVYPGLKAAPAAPSGNTPFDDAQTFGGFTVLGATPTGRTLFIKLPKALTLELAMTQAADELGKVFDAKPALSGAFADEKGRSKGGVTLTGKLKGQDIHGVIFCGTQPNGSTATVIIATAGTSKEDVATLYGSMPAPAIKMTTHKFPDGSGSVDLPDGWTTPNTSAAHGVGVEGPGGQVVIFCNIMMLREPDCSFVKQMDQNYPMQLNMYNMQLQTYRQNVEARKRFPNILALQEPKPPVKPDPDPNVRFPGMTFCRYCDGPEEVLKTWFPIREKIQRRAGGGSTTLDKVFEVVPLPPNPLMPGSKTGLAYIALSDHDGDKVTHVRSAMQISTAHIIAGESWQLSACNMRAPDETFDKDLPVMQAIMNSVNLDMNVIGKETQAETDAALAYGRQLNEQLLKRGRDFQDQQAIRFNNFQSQMAAQQQARHDSASDFIEYIGGVRHVYDTRTGRTLNVDLFNSNAITNGLNEAANNPGQYIQIPLRYER